MLLAVDFELYILLIMIYHLPVVVIGEQFAPIEAFYPRNGKDCLVDFSQLTIETVSAER